jgi:hypothetical protein
MTLYGPGTNGAIWAHCSAPDGLMVVAPLNASVFYALCNQDDTTGLYLCDGMGNNTLVPHPENRTLKSISVGRWTEPFGLSTPLAQLGET